MDIIFVILIAVAALVLGAVGGYFVFQKVITGKRDEIMESAEKEAEVIKKKKLWK